MNKYVIVCTAFMKAAGAFWRTAKKAVKDGVVTEAEWSEMSLEVSRTLENNLPVTVIVKVSIEPK